MPGQHTDISCYSPPFSLTALDVTISQRMKTGVYFRTHESKTSKREVCESESFARNRCNPFFRVRFSLLLAFQFPTSVLTFGWISMLERNTATPYSLSNGNSHRFFFFKIFFWANALTSALSHFQHVAVSPPERGDPSHTWENQPSTNRIINIFPSREEDCKYFTETTAKCRVIHMYNEGWQNCNILDNVPVQHIY